MKLENLNEIKKLSDVLDQIKERLSITNKTITVSQDEKQYQPKTLANACGKPGKEDYYAVFTDEETDILVMLTTNALKRREQEVMSQLEELGVKFDK